MKYITLKFFSRNLDQIIILLTKLDQMLDDYIVREEAKASNLEQAIDELVNKKKTLQAEVAQARTIKSNIKKNILG